MASKKQQKPKSPSLPRFNWRDERFPKIAGVILIMAAIYLAIAFVSYLYTWKMDQDKVLKFSWGMLFQGDLNVQNWLGRLGAIISNMFFYWGFGLPSMIVVVMLIKLGFDLVRRKSLIPFMVFARNSFVIMAFFSLLLEFIFRRSEFTWGGAFGESTCFWLTNFIGQIGLFFLLLFTMGAYIMWRFNPNFDNLTFSNPLANVSLPSVSMDFFKGMEDSEIKPKRKSVVENITDDIEDLFLQTLRPSGYNKQESAIPQTPTAEQQVGSNDMEMDFDLPAAATFPTISKTPADLTLDIDESSNLSLENISREDDFTEVGPSMGRVPVAPETQIEAIKLEDDLEPYDPTADLRRYKMPSTDLLLEYADQKVEVDRAELEANKDQIIATLLNYKIEITKIRATIGPTVTLYEIVPAPGVKISKIKNLEDDIALSLSALGIRIIAPIPGKGTIGIEVPNKNKQIVSIKEVLSSEKFINTKMALPIALGKTISNEVFVADLAKMPHLLVAGATGQGKSVGINAILMSLLYKKHPSQVKLVLIDPKKVELFPYGYLDQHYLAFIPDQDEPIITETSKVINTLNSLCIEMDNRYDLLKKARVRNLNEYNEKFIDRKLSPKDGHKFLPYIVLVIDEFADLIMTAGKEVELPIARLAQLARAIGIHLIIATQRPSVNIITGIIKANFPARLAFKVTSKIDSRTILDGGGADQLIGMGDMLLSIGSNNVRIQCAFVDTPEVESVIKHIADQPGFAEPFYLPEYKSDDETGAGNSDLKMSDLDENFDEAARLIISAQHGSTSLIQRKMQLGYNRAGRIMDQMEQLGIVGPAQGSKPREVLFYSIDELNNFLTAMRNR
ncbi:MAG: DNA translocase FtsK [Saprospiraceae bacterium]|jgi:S-DNA-T family DNA segregation ATPase FtsK/SpoIIIE|nr:DNA translocase FtsK [Saprospiraceae bacterium]MBP6448020.1 DNA translocase FtsK [Saprospiraceae bacterium]